MAEAMLAGDGERWRVEIYGVPYSKVLNLPQPDRVWRIKEGKRIVATRLLQADAHRIVADHNAALTTPRERELLEALREAAQHAHRSMHMNKVFYPDRTLVTDCPGALCRKWSDAIDAYEKRGAPK